MPPAAVCFGGGGGDLSARETRGWEPPPMTYAPAPWAKVGKSRDIQGSDQGFQYNWLAILEHCTAIRKFSINRSHFLLSLDKKPFETDLSAESVRLSSPAPECLWLDPFGA